MPSSSIGAGSHRELPRPEPPGPMSAMVAIAIGCILVLLAVFIVLIIFLGQSCDRTFMSRPGGPQNGSFLAPVFYNPTNFSRQCVYTFIAGPRQRVELVFTSFNLRGTPP
ncbi:hypothetical protein B566_EDAN002030, partial [Ephemera danica]